MTPSLFHRLACVLAPLVACHPFPLQATPTPPVKPALHQVQEQLQRASSQLQQVWQQDPATARRPFPAIRLVENVSRSDCPAAPFSASGPLVLACPGRGEILVEPTKLAALNGVFGEAAELFVVAYGLGQSLITPALTPTPATATAPAATAALRAACTAGTMIAALPRPLADRRLVLNNAISAAEQAFASSAASQLGTGPQRAYALLSGIGGTPLDCGAAAMARLASGAESLEAFLATRGYSVGVDVDCRQPPACPRRLQGV